jgi:hypothetical protein
MIFSKTATTFLTSLILISFVGCGNDDDNNNKTGGLTPIEKVSDAKEAFVAVDLTPAADIEAPYKALSLSAELIRDDLRTVLVTNSTLGLCKYGGDARYRKDAVTIATLIYNNCKKSSHITLNGSATISPLSGNVTVSYKGFRLKKSTQSALLNTTASYGNWDNFSSKNGVLSIQLNGSSQTTYAPEDEEEDDNETVTTIYPYMSYTYNNFTTNITMKNKTITKFDANGIVATNYIKDAQSCANGTYSVTTQKSMEPVGNTLAKGEITINGVDYSFEDTNATITLYGDDIAVAQSELEITCD